MMLVTDQNAVFNFRYVFSKRVLSHRADGHTVGPLKVKLPSG